MIELRERLVDLLMDCDCPYPCKSADYLVENGVTIQTSARPLEEWGEDHGDVLWWVFPVCEPPYVGSPLDAAWPGYHTHWTPLPEPPEAPDESL